MTFTLLQRKGCCSHGLSEGFCASIAPVAQAAARRGTAWGTRADGQYALQRAWQRGALGCKVQ